MMGFCQSLDTHWSSALWPASLISHGTFVHIHCAMWRTCKTARSFLDWALDENQIFLESIVVYFHLRHIRVPHGHARSSVPPCASARPLLSLHGPMRIRKNYSPSPSRLSVNLVIFPSIHATNHLLYSLRITPWTSSWKKQVLNSRDPVKFPSVKN